MTPEWQKLANKMRGNVKIAYFDTTKSQTPRLVGQIRGDPRSSLSIPKRTNELNKKTSDYNGAREYKPLAEFAVSRMPNFVKLISGEKGLKEFGEKANAIIYPNFCLPRKTKRHRC